MTRLQVIGLWLLCSITMPLTYIAFTYQAWFGNTERSVHIAIAHDIYSNNACGGTIGSTVSRQVGNAMKRGKPWAFRCARIIDFILGENHCISNANI